MANLEREKQLAAARGVDWVQPGMRVGLGSGSTVAYLIPLLGQRVRQGLEILAVPTSEQTRRLAEAEGIPVAQPGRQLAELDLTIDGTDEFDPQFRLIKGGGGALLREKLVASISRKVVIIADSSKAVPSLGQFPLPVEVVSFGWEVVAVKLEALGARTRLRRRKDGEIFRTDHGNYIVDCRFHPFPCPEELARALDVTVGVIEHGLFLDMVDTVILGRRESVEILTREKTR